MSDSRDEDPIDLARRRFILSGGKYVAPAVLASLLVGEQAWGQCPPYVRRCSPFRQCSPGQCGPLINPCRPAGG